ncbi:MAG: fatty acid desaturase [bacterium]
MSTVTATASTFSAASVPAPRADEKVSSKSLPFFLMHVAVLGAVFTGARPVDWLLCLGLYYLRMFGITAGFHRYFSHRAYKTNRVFQFVLAWIGTMSAQKGVLWWAGHHRHHHRFSDTEEDIHSPTKRGFWWSHVGWILSSRYDETPLDDIRDFAKYPELRWLNDHYLVPPTLLAIAVTMLFGWSGLFVGFFLSTVLLWHGTFTINSLSHVFGSQRYVTGDTSRNNFLLAILTMGEGWHNNHHYYQSTANQGFYWWEIDLSYYVLKALSVVGLVSNLRTPSERVLRSNRVGSTPEPRDAAVRVPAAVEPIPTALAA